MSPQAIRVFLPNRRPFPKTLMCLLAQERLKRKSALIRASMRQDDKKAMAQHVAVLRAGPKAGAEPPRAGTTKSTYHAPPTQEGWLAWATPNGSTRRYYRLVGSYLVRYADEEAARGASLGAERGSGDRERVYASRVDGVDADATPRRRRRDAALPRRRLHDHQSVDTRRRGDLRGLRPRHGSPDIGQRRPRLRRRPREPGLVLLRVHLPERSPYMLRTWKRSAPGSLHCERPASRCTMPKNSRRRPRPSRRWLRCCSTRPSASSSACTRSWPPSKCTGYVVQDERVKSLKKGYLEFQRARGVPSCRVTPSISCPSHDAVGRFFFDFGAISDRDAPHRRAEYEDEQFYGKLLEDSTTSEPRFAKAYCVLRSDQTLVYGSSEKEAKANPEGVVSLNHLHVVLDADAIEKSGDMVFSLVTPLRTFVVRAAHQVALEEWLKAIIRSTAKLDDKGNTLQALNELQEMDATEGVDLASLIDDDSGLDAFERFVSSLEDKKTKDVFACWRLCREHKDASEFDPLEFADTSVLVKQLEKRLVEDFLEDGGRLPSEIAVDAQKGVYCCYVSPRRKGFTGERSARRVCCGVAFISL